MDVFEWYVFENVSSLYRGMHYMSISLLCIVFAVLLVGCQEQPRRSRKRRRSKLYVIRVPPKIHV